MEMMANDGWLIGHWVNAATTSSATSLRQNGTRKATAVIRRGKIHQKNYGGL